MSADHGPATPYLRVDPDRLDRNIAAMAALAADRGLALRPHAKTHKSLEVACRQLDAGAVGLAVATVGEAEVFADLLAVRGRDVFVAYPVAVEPARLGALVARVPTIVGVDSRAGADGVVGTGARVSVEVDCGLRRSGVQPDAAGELAAYARDRGVEVVGVFTFPGHGYGIDGAPVRAAADEAAALGEAAESMRAAGFERIVRSGGCTPSAAATDADAVDELRPGVYVFMDAQQLALGTASLEQIALTVEATVVSDAVPGQVIVDAGAKVLGIDRPAYVPGHGIVPAYPDATVVRVWEHHGVVEIPAGTPAPIVGERLTIVPNHVCSVVNLVDELLVGDSRWRVDARGRNT